MQVFDKVNRFLFKFGDIGDEKLSKHATSVFHNDMFFLTDPDNNCIKLFDNKGDFLYEIGKSSIGDGEFSRPTGLYVDSNDALIVCKRQ